MRSIRLERETPITSATVVIGNCPSAATAAAAAVFLTPWHVRRASLRISASSVFLPTARAPGSAKPDNPRPARPVPRRRQPSAPHHKPAPREQLGEERPHSRLVACSDPSDQSFFGRIFVSRRRPLRRRGCSSFAEANRSHRRHPL